MFSPMICPVAFAALAQDGKMDRTLLRVLWSFAKNMEPPYNLLKLYGIITINGKSKQDENAIYLNKFKQLTLF